MNIVYSLNNLVSKNYQSFRVFYLLLFRSFRPSEEKKKSRKSWLFKIRMMAIVSDEEPSWNVFPSFSSDDRWPKQMIIYKYFQNNSMKKNHNLIEYFYFSSKTTCGRYHLRSPVDCLTFRLGRNAEKKTHTHNAFDGICAKTFKWYNFCDANSKLLRATRTRKAIMLSSEKKKKQ